MLPKFGVHLVYPYIGTEYKDYPNGARVCIAIAKRVSQEIFNNGSELFLTLKKKSNFQWTQLPQVRTPQLVQSIATLANFVFNIILLHSYLSTALRSYRVIIPSG
jgi:hypothetical protein